MDARGREQRDDAGYLAALVEALPGGIFVIDGVGTIRFATAEAANLVEMDAGDLVGHSVLEYVDEETAWAYAAAVALAGDFPDVVAGPMRVMVVSSSGVRRSADLWAMNRVDDPVLQGIVCLLTPETASLGLGEAVMAIAAKAPFVTVVSRVIRAMGGHPTTARAALLSAGPTGMTLVGDTASGDLPDMSGPGPWEDASITGVRSLAASLDELPDAVAADARRLGYETAWAEPIGRGGEPARGVLVLWRRSPGRPTPNELNVMHQAAALLAMAWAPPERV